MKIFIGVPNLGTLGTRLSRRLREWYTSNRHQITIAEATGLRPLELSINRLLALFLETDCEYLFLINSDECIPFSGLDRLIAHDVDVVAPLGLNWNNQKGPFPCIGMLEGGDDSEFARHFDDPTGITMSSSRTRYVQPSSGFHGLRRVDRIGNSGMLLKRKVVESVPLGEFRMLMSDDRTEIQATEDYAWCDAIRAAGFEIWVDCDMLLSHTKPVDLSDVTRMLLEARDKGRRDSVAAIRKMLAAGATPDEALDGVIEWLSMQRATS